MSDKHAITEAGRTVHPGALGKTELALLHELRRVRHGLRLRPPTRDPAKAPLGQRLADGFAATMGSWSFIIIQSALLIAWVVLNIAGWIKAWDPYPFILLNLALSFQAAYAAPIIMMSQNRQADIDRHEAENDYKVNIKAELEIELLHQKLDELRQSEVLALTQAVRALAEALGHGHVCDHLQSASAPVPAPQAETPPESDPAT